MFKLESDSSFFSNVAAMFGKGHFYLRISPVDVVGSAFNQNGYSARAVSFIHYFLDLTAAKFSAAPVDRALNVGCGHVGRFGLVDCQAQAEVGFRVCSAAGGNCY